MELNGQHHASTALLPGKEPPVWMGFSVTVGNWEKRIFLPLPGIETRFLKSSCPYPRHHTYQATRRTFNTVAQGWPNSTHRRATHHPRAAIVYTSIENHKQIFLYCVLSWKWWVVSQFLKMFSANKFDTLCSIYTYYNHVC